MSPSDSLESNLAVLASGRGSNLEALIAAHRTGRLRAPIVAVISDRSGARALDVARASGIPAHLVIRGDRSVAQHEAEILAVLRDHGARWLALAGYMRRVGPTLLEAFPDRVLNIHPSLLPAFPGLEAQRQTLDAGSRISGCTVHVVDSGLDTGPIVMQSAVPVADDDTVDTLSTRILGAEHRLYSRALDAWIHGELALDRTTPPCPRVVRRAVRSAQAQPRLALISVADKTGIVDFARKLTEGRWELVSTGGTARCLVEAGLAVTPLEQLTGFPEILGGRVKTLHPAVHGGILARLDVEADRHALAVHGIAGLDLVVVDLYPFEAAAADPSRSRAQVVEEIDIGGVALLRAAAKNHDRVTVVSSPRQYELVARTMVTDPAGDPGLREALAAAALARVARYDAAIAAWMVENVRWAENPGPRAEAPPSDEVHPGPFPARLELTLDRLADLRYGENPHQAAAVYAPTGSVSGLAAARPLTGKAPSYNNYLDCDAALGILRSMRTGSAVVIKHGNPCGAASAPSAAAALGAAIDGDPISAFGAVIGLNVPFDEGAARVLVDRKLFVEVVVAPRITPEARDALKARKDLRLMEVAAAGPAPTGSLRAIDGGWLMQQPDPRRDDPAQWKLVTRREPDPAQRLALEFAWTLCAGVTSNAIVLATSGAGGVLMATGIGAGQTSRVDAVECAVKKAGARAPSSVLASDAFFPFPDGLEAAAAAGVRAVVQPGGSKQDGAVIEAADRHGMAMVLTGIRHFKH